MPQNTHWDGGETDAFLDSILTGADVVVGGGLDVLCDNTDSNSDCGSYSSSSSSSSSSMIPSPSHSSPTVITIQHDDPSSGEPHQTRLTLEDEDVVMSAPVTQSGGGLDPEEDDDPPVTLTAVNPVTNSPPELATAATPITIINSLTNTSMPHIVWPVMNKNKTHKVSGKKYNSMSPLADLFSL